MVDITLIKYNDKDKNALIQGKEYYSGILIEASTALLKFKSLSQFLTKIKKPFAIDPSTYRFRQEFNEEEERISIQQLKERYGLPAEEDIYPETFTEDFAKVFVRNVITFQNTIFLPSKQTLILQYFSKDNNLQPRWIIPPYFPIEEFDDPWMETNIQLAKYTSKLAGNKEIFPILSILEEDVLLQLDEMKVSEYIKEFPGNILGLWITDFDKKSISEEYLQAYYEFVSLIKKYKEKVILMYANFFDILLQPYGISHGVSGGDVRYSRSWVSREYIKIYIPFLKREFTIEAAVPILVKYGAQLGYNKTKDVLDIIRALFQLDKEYSELRKKGMTPNGFRISQLSDDDKKRYKELGNKINELKDQLKLEFLKERNRECKVDIQEELKILEKVVDIIKASEKSKTIAKRYVGHLERWIETIRTMSP